MSKSPFESMRQALRARPPRKREVQAPIPKGPKIQFVDPGENFLDYQGVERTAPIFLYRSSDHLPELKRIVSKPFFAATTFRKAALYGQYVAVYRFLGGNISVGLQEHMITHQDEYRHYSTADPEAVRRTKADLAMARILPTASGLMEAEETEVIVIRPRKILRLEEIKEVLP